MELDKIFGSHGVVPVSSERRTNSTREDTSDIFAHMLQNLRESKAANAHDHSNTEGNTVITRVLADGSVITQIYEGTKLVSQTMTRGSHPEAGKEVISETLEKLKPDTLEKSANPLLASKAAQSSVATAALVSAMI